LGRIPIGLGAAADLFCAPMAAEGASPRTVEWYRIIVGRAVRRFGEARPVDAIPAAELQAWLLELRSSLAPESIAGYVRGLKAFGNWCADEEVAAALCRSCLPFERHRLGDDGEPALDVGRDPDLPTPDRGPATEAPNPGVSDRSFRGDRPETTSRLSSLEKPVGAFEIAYGCGGSRRRRLGPRVDTRRLWTAAYVRFRASIVRSYERCATPTNRQSITASWAIRLAIAPER
jgi:hypothetical protein